MEARKAVAEKLGFAIEMRNDESVCAFIIPLDEGHYRHVTASDGIEAFNLCVSLQEDNQKLTAENLSLQERVDALEKALRGEWWGNHGCNPGVRYGDDGKMQCGVCITDFATMPFDELRKRVASLRLRAALSPKEGVK